MLKTGHLKLLKSGHLKLLLTAAEILSGFRHIALNLLKNEKTFDGGIERKMKCAMMSTDYLEQILDGSPLLTPESEKA